MRKHPSTALAAVVLAPLALAAPASAAAGNGARITHFEECFPPTGGPDQSCISGREVFHFRETPSGNTIAHVNGSLRYNVTGSITATGTIRTHFKFLVKDGQQHLETFQERRSGVEGGLICTGIVRRMVVKGEVKTAISSFSCEVP